MNEILNNSTEKDCQPKLSGNMLPRVMRGSFGHGAMNMMKLYNTVQEDEVNSRVMRNLNAGQSYYFVNEAYNENGVSVKSVVREIK